MNTKIVSGKSQEIISQLFDNQLRRYPPGQILIFADDVVDNLGYIKSGYVKVYNINEDGSTHIVFILTPGMVFPIFTLLALKRLPCRYFYEAMTDIEANIVPLDQAKKGLNDAKVDVLAELSFIGQSLLADMVDVMSMPRAENRIRKLMFILTDWLDGDEPDAQLVTLRVKLTHQDIACMTGLTRETASTVIQKLKEEKSLYYKDQRLVVDRRILQRAR